MVGIVATAEIDLAVPAGRVWTALTDPEEISAYMFGTWVETDWSVGGPILWRGEWEGKPYQDKGEVLEVDERRRLVVTHFSPLSGQDDVPESYHRLVYTLEERGETTHLTLSQDNNGTEDEAHRAAATWEQMLLALRSLLEA